MHFVMYASSNHVEVLHNVKRNVGADLHIRPNIPYLYHSNCLAPLNLRKPLATRCVRTNQSIHSFRLWEPKSSGASGSVGAERYFREGMLALPYQYRKFGGYAISLTIRNL